MSLPRLPLLVALLTLSTACSSSGTKQIHSGLSDAGSSDAGADAESTSDDSDASNGDPEADSDTVDAAGPEGTDAAASGDAGSSLEAGIGSDAAVGSDASTSPDAGVGASLVKSRCGAPISIDAAPRIASSPIMRWRPNGNIAVTWQEVDGPAANYRDVVRAFVGGAFSAPHTLSENAASRAEAAIDDQGNLHVHWAESLGLDREREEYNAGAGQWSGKVQWFTDRGSEITLPLKMFALNPAGLTLHTMFYNLNSSATAAVAVFDPTSDQWGAIHPLEGSANNTGVDIPMAAVNDAGQAVVIWGFTDNTTGQNLHSFRASTLSGGVFSAPVSTPGGTTFYDVAMLSGGDTLLVYANTDRVSSRRFSPSANAGQEWGPEQTVDMMPPGMPTLVVDAADNITAIWVNGQQIRAARYEGGSWQPAVGLGITALGPSVALDTSGNVSLVYGNDNAPIKLRRLAASGGAWTAPIDVANETGTVQVPMVAHDASGNVIVAYALGRALAQGGTDSHIRWVVCE